MALLTLTAIIVPALIPSEYHPVDPTSTAKGGDEQVVSWWSFITFSFLDHLITKASKVDHLSYDQLPPMLDNDASEYLTTTSFSVRLKDSSRNFRSVLIFSTL